ncbi:cytochrome c oxidase assembly protein [Tessaracoccus caeni]|uniref:cytochrome c oxidase assembly protein n=1 Tax=Tessaracoccus caeni TaxID=3031239 RepID=UPI0023DB1022|nr:cytochrome c oxidase assembly protein [Tessaracoccus caeni]MDF1489835.1 cytochrome c oxidase assembly protein [Tessaracoccus caeni]
MDNPTAPTGGRSLIAGIIVATALAITVPVTLTVMAGSEPYGIVIRAFPGVVVAAMTALLQALSELTATLTMGALTAVLFLRSVSARESHDLIPGHDLTTLRVASKSWATITVSLAIMELLDWSGVPFSGITSPGVFSYILASYPYPGMLAVRLAAVLLVAFVVTFATRWTTLLIAVWASAIAILGPIVVGHVLVGPSHDLGGDAAVVQAVTSYPLLGAVAVFALLLAMGTPPSATSWRRLVRMAWIALPVILITDLIITWFLLAGSSLLASLTGVLIVGRWAALALVTSGLLFTRAPLHRPRPPRALPPILTMLGIGLWVAFTVSMLREPPPQFFVPTSINEIFLGFEVREAPTLSVLFTHWRLNLLFAVVAAVGIISYLIAVFAARRRGVSWPWPRIAAWSLGWILVVYATSSGFGKYSAPHFGVHMIVHMGLSMLVPILLSLGGIVTLLLRASSARTVTDGLHQWVSWIIGWRVLRVLYNPLIAFSLFISSYYVLYFTGIFEFLMSYHWGHQLMNAHFLVVGYLYYSLLIGVDPAPRPLPHIAKLGLAMAAMPFHAFFGVILMSGGNIVAEGYYRYLDIPWADLAAAQEMGGGVAWAGGEPASLIVVIALGVQWARQDRREAARIDRHFDTGLDADYDDYNRMLQRLAAPAPPPRNNEES